MVDILDTYPEEAKRFDYGLAFIKIGDKTAKYGIKDGMIADAIMIQKKLKHKLVLKT